MTDRITALKSSQVRTLVEGGALQLGLFDKNLFELTHPDYPGEGVDPILSGQRES